MKDISLFKKETLIKIQRFRKIFLLTAVWIIIAELIFGAFLILVETWNVEIGKIQGTFLVLATILLIGVNNFMHLEKNNSAIQIFALTSFICNLIWGFLACLLIWGAVPFTWEEEVVRYGGYYGESHLTICSIFMFIAAYTSVAGLWISNILAIKEVSKSVKPLKITANVCAVYLWLFWVITIIGEFDFGDAPKLYSLAGLAFLAAIITAVAAIAISRSSDHKSTKPKNHEPAKPAASKTEAELRAEIEEKIRREMLEREIRAKLESELSAKNAEHGTEDNR